MSVTGFHTQSKRRSESRRRGMRLALREGTFAFVSGAGTLNKKWRFFLCANFLSGT